MKKIFIVIALFSMVAGCNNHRQLQEEVDNTPSKIKKAPVKPEVPTQMKKGFDGREMGGGGGNR